MQSRQLIDSTYVSELGLGCMGMSEFYGPRDDKRSLRVLDRALDLGINFFDTADTYGPHHNEELLGQFLRSRRPNAIIATKFGICRRPGEYARSIDNDPDYVRQACDASLRRLGVDCIDLYYVHRIDSRYPIEQTMSVLSDLVQAGKIKHIGICEASSDTIRRAHNVHRLAAVQSEYSLWSRDIERDVIPTCRELGIRIVAYSPLGRGILTGSIDETTEFHTDDFRRSLPRFVGENFSRNLTLVDTLRALASSRGCTPGQLAIAWLLAKGEDIVPIPGTKRIRYLEENVASADIQLSTDDVLQLDTAIDPSMVAGNRYTAEGMKGVNV